MNQLRAYEDKLEQIQFNNEIRESKQLKRESKRIRELERNQKSREHQQEI